MEKYLDILGYEVRDRVTGFAGVADSVCYDLYGCVQISITPKHDPKEKERKLGSWFDYKRLEKTNQTRVMPAPTFPPPGSEHGPAAKSAR